MISFFYVIIQLQQLNEGFVQLDFVVDIVCVNDFYKCGSVIQFLKQVLYGVVVYFGVLIDIQSKVFERLCVK